MTVTEQTPEISYTADGVEDTFSYNFLIQDENDIAVYENNILTALPYTVTDVGNPSGGDVVFTTVDDPPPGNGVTVTLKREMAYSQEVDLISYGNPPITVYENAMDTLAMQIQQLQAEFARCLKIPASLQGVIDTELDITPETDITSTVVGFNASDEPVLTPADTLDFDQDVDMQGNDLLLGSGGIVRGVNNEFFIQGRNAANNDWLNLLKANAADFLEVGVMVDLNDLGIKRSGDINTNEGDIILGNGAINQGTIITEKSSINASGATKAPISLAFADNVIYHFLGRFEPISGIGALYAEFNTSTSGYASNTANQASASGGAWTTDYLTNRITIGVSGAEGLLEFTAHRGHVDDNIIMISGRYINNAYGVVIWGGIWDKGSVVGTETLNIQFGAGSGNLTIRGMLEKITI